ncbi:MAG: major capsid protein [Anaerolineae bacterium]|nr:major capsid protein [Anaerolineae bacterium]
MSQMNPAATRVVDPILSQHARGYRQAGLVGEILFPRAPVPQYGGNVIEFGKEAFRLYNSRRAPGASTKRISFGYAGKPYTITPSALEASVPRELMRDASQVPGIDLAARAVNTVSRAMRLEHEYNCAQIARNTANYDGTHRVALVGADRWTGATSNPSEDVEAGKEAIRTAIGVTPNVAVVSAAAMSALRFNPQILDRIKHTGRDTPTADLLASLWGIRRVVVGEAVVATGSNDTLGDVWGQDVILAYAAESTGDVNANAEEPSYGYTYFIDGHPLVEQPYWDNSTKSWVYGVSDDNSPVLSGMVAGYLIQNAGAAAA